MYLVSSEYFLKVSCIALDLDPPSNTCFTGPTGVYIPIGFSVGSAVFAGLTNVTSFLAPKISAKFQGDPPTGAPNKGGVGSNWRFSTNT